MVSKGLYHFLIKRLEIEKREVALSDYDRLKEKRKGWAFEKISSII